MTYIAIDLKSFYASVECVERGLDPLTTNLVVADAGRTEKTICLAVSPSLKAYGIPGRARLFEVVQKVKEINALRLSKAPSRTFSGETYNAPELKSHRELSLSYITALPRMTLYIDYSTRVYNIYLKYIAPEDIHVYSIDEVFIDVTNYLDTYRLTARQLTQKLILEVLSATGVTATAGIGTNLYLAKIAMDIGAKHITPDENGVRIAELDEMSYRKGLWSHEPLTDFWRVGHGYARKLEKAGMYTMGDIARRSVDDENSLYKLFGINAELLIDHAWGWEPCTIAHIKAYKPAGSSISTGQVLQEPYSFEKAKLIVREMADALSLDLVEKGLVTNQIILAIGYDVTSLSDEHIAEQYSGEVTVDYYGRRVPKGVNGSFSLDRKTSSARLITDAAVGIFDKTVNPLLLIRRVNIAANNVIPERDAQTGNAEQLDLFTDYSEKERVDMELEREKKLQQAVISLKQKYGKNAVLKAMSLEEGATARSRNAQIGGHKA